MKIVTIMVGCIAVVLMCFLFYMLFSSDKA